MTVAELKKELSEIPDNFEVLLSEYSLSKVKPEVYLNMCYLTEDRYADGYEKGYKDGIREAANVKELA